MPSDLVVLLATSGLPLGLVKATELLKSSGALSSTQARKFLHILTGLLFMLTWPLYSAEPSARCGGDCAAPSAGSPRRALQQGCPAHGVGRNCMRACACDRACGRYYAAALPGLMALRFILAGLGVTDEAKLVAGTAVSRGCCCAAGAGAAQAPRNMHWLTASWLLCCAAQRSGRRRELLAGPTLYGLAHVALTILAWRTSPAGVAGLSALCAGALARARATPRHSMHRTAHTSTQLHCSTTVPCYAAAQVMAWQTSSAGRWQGGCMAAASPPSCRMLRTRAGWAAWPALSAHARRPPACCCCSTVSASECGLAGRW